MPQPDLIIRVAEPADAPAVWSVLEPVLRSGDTYAMPPDLSRDDALAWWFGPQHEVFVAQSDGAVFGTYYLMANQRGPGSHVANCGYVTAPAAQGRGVARAMCRHSLRRAVSRGFRAMQFNLVVSTNVRAVRLWHSLGFQIVGTIPEAFHHPEAGYVAAHVMYRSLADEEDAGTPG